MPSGELLSGHAEVAGSDVEMILEAEDSPHEWLGWQHLVGNVESASSPLPNEGARRVRGRRTRSRSGEAAAGMSSTEPEEPRWLQSEELQWLAEANGALVSKATDVWSRLALAQGSSGEVISALNRGKPGRVIAPADQDQVRAVYRLVRDSSGRSRAIAMEGSNPREFVVVPREAVVELLALPMPWPVVGSGREAVVEVVVRHACPATDFASSIAVRDDRIGVLLGFLTSGALDAGREMAEASRDLLFGKTVNPLAAAAGAYALAGTATDTANHEWHSWVRNLAQWFDQVPDGAIQLGWLLLRMRRTPAELDEARHWLKEGYRRGLPFYALGVRWLLDGLERVARVDPEAEAMLKAVQPIGSRLHPHSPFTILRLGERTDVRD